MAGPAVVREKAVQINGEWYVLRRNYTARAAYEALSQEVDGSIAYAIAMAESEELKIPKPDRPERKDYFTRMAMWLFALSATHRKANQNKLTFEQFVDLLPFEDTDLAPLIEAVNFVVWGIDPGNDETPAATESDAGEKKSDEPPAEAEKTGESAPGDASDTSQP